MSSRATESKEIIYGERADQLIFIPKQRALELASIHEALNTSKTWGEFKSRVPRSHLRRSFGDDARRV